MKKLLYTLLAVSIIFSACKKEEDEPNNSENNNSALAIGDTHQGGIVFYLDANGGGLVAAPSNQVSGAEWGCKGIAITYTETGIGSGAQNTINIEAGCPTQGTAADICANLTLNGYSDWFLPSKDELLEMHNNLCLQGIGNFTGTNGEAYWSSTEIDQNRVWTMYFDPPKMMNNLLMEAGASSAGTDEKDCPVNNLRAIRAF